jgi:hypothetical protein
VVDGSWLPRTARAVAHLVAQEGCPPARPFHRPAWRSIRQVGNATSAQSFSQVSSSSAAVRSFVFVANPRRRRLMHRAFRPVTALPPGPYRERSRACCAACRTSSM